MMSLTRTEEYKSDTCEICPGNRIWAPRVNWSCYSKVIIHVQKALGIHGHWVPRGPPLRRAYPCRMQSSALYCSALVHVPYNTVQLLLKAGCLSTSLKFLPLQLSTFIFSLSP
jgi:hypothetical protein